MPLFQNMFLSMSFQDIFKSSFLSKAAEFSILDVLIAMASSFGLGLLILFIYKKTFMGVMYSAGFGISLLAMTLITTLVILTITSNVILSLGMVGALSIVRFRTAVKEPLDIVFMFWAISSGIVVGAGLLLLALIGSAIIAGALVVFTGDKKGVGSKYILVLCLEDGNAEPNATEIVKAGVKKCVVKSKTASKAGIELTMEVVLPGESTAIVNDLLSAAGVTSAVLVSCGSEAVL